MDYNSSEIALKEIYLFREREKKKKKTRLHDESTGLIYQEK